MRPRQSNNPKRRILAPDALSAAERAAIKQRARYVGSALHKRFPADYGFHPPTNPRPHKSLCDDRRSIAHEEARLLLAAAIDRAMVSPVHGEDLPKYVWSVDDMGEVYEAKLGNGGYHGYRLDEATELAMCRLVLGEWQKR